MEIIRHIKGLKQNGKDATHTVVICDDTQKYSGDLLSMIGELEMGKKHVNIPVAYTMQSQEITYTRMNEDEETKTAVLYLGISSQDNWVVVRQRIELESSLENILFLILVEFWDDRVLDRLSIWRRTIYQITSGIRAEKSTIVVIIHDGASLPHGTAIRQQEVTACRLRHQALELNETIVSLHVPLVKGNKNLIGFQNMIKNNVLGTKYELEIDYEVATMLVPAGMDSIDKIQTRCRELSCDLSHPLPCISNDVPVDTHIKVKELIRMDDFVRNLKNMFPDRIMVQSQVDGCDGIWKGDEKQEALADFFHGLIANTASRARPSAVGLPKAFKDV